MCVYLPFTENRICQIQALCMQDSVNLHNNLNVEVRAVFFTFIYEEAEPQRSLKLCQDYATSKW